VSGLEESARERVMTRADTSTRLCTAWAAASFALLMGPVYLDRHFYETTHSWLFGIDRLVVEHHEKVAVAVVAPLFVPILLVRNAATIALCVAACLYLAVLLRFLSIAGH
jgi:hypothetical protein